MDLATAEEKTRCVKLYGLSASLMRGRALQLVQAVEDSNELDAWRSLNKALKPTSNALQPQLLKLEEVFDETVKAGTTFQEEVKSAIVLRCVGGQLKAYLILTIGDNVQYSALREQVLQWDRSQQKWATSSSTDNQGPMPMDIYRVQVAKGKGKKGQRDHQKGKGTDAKGKGKKGKGDQKGRKVIARAKVKAKTKKGKGAATGFALTLTLTHTHSHSHSHSLSLSLSPTLTHTHLHSHSHTCVKPGHLAKDCWRNNIRQVASDPAHSSARGATHTVDQQHANVSQQSRSAETEPVVSRIENSEPIIFDVREGEKGMVS